MPILCLCLKHLSTEVSHTQMAALSLQVLRRVLPALQSLSEDEDAAVQRAAIDGLAQLLCLHGSNKELTSRLYSHLDELVTSNHSQVSVSVSK